MPGSYKRINFNIRPAKSVERKLFVDAAGYLKSIAPGSDFRYIGLGSPFFGDFVLFHRRLGIQNMTNIEANGNDRERFEFNKPFDCISMEYGLSTSVLPMLDLDTVPAIIWMDYDDALQPYMMEDISIIVSQVPTPSLILFTVNVAEPVPHKVDPDANIDSWEDLYKARYDNFSIQFPSQIPLGTDPKMFDQSGFRSVVWQMINSRINEVVDGRKGFGGDPISYQQIFNIAYADGQPMMTVGGFLLSDKDRVILNDLPLMGHDYVRTSAGAYELKVPSITLREQRRIDRDLPGGKPESPGVSQAKIEQYSEIYRYYPSFVEAEL